MHDIGLRIKYRRVELGMTQMELAKRMGYTSKAAVCKVENGQDNLTTDRVRKFADALDCNPEYLMGWTSEPIESTHIDENEDDETLKAKELYRKYKEAPEQIKAAINNLLGLEE